MIGTSSHYHLGCGPQHLDGFVNVDVRDTQAADLVADLNTLDGLPPGEAKGFFSHAFFEHLYRDSRLGHLRAARERLASDGFVCYIGLPDFQRVAELYLSQGRGVEGPTFDLHNVYRYTHGDPEMGGTEMSSTEWLPQLHKSLFDFTEVDRLLRDAGFGSYTIFRYAFPADPPEVGALTLGFYATRGQCTAVQDDARTFLAEFDGRFITLDSMAFAVARSRSRPIANAVASGQVLSARRLAYRVACRLAEMT
jgi:predicted SAM-dependent methyltransferase